MKHFDPEADAPEIPDFTIPDFTQPPPKAAPRSAVKAKPALTMKRVTEALKPFTDHVAATFEVFNSNDKDLGKCIETLTETIKTQKADIADLKSTNATLRQSVDNLIERVNAADDLILELIDRK